VSIHGVRYLVCAGEKDYTEMAQQYHQPVPNRDFDPTEQQQEVLDVFCEEYQVNPMRIRDVTEMPKQRVNDILGSLRDAGWIKQVTRGLYRLVYDGDCIVSQEVRCREEGKDE